MRIDYIHILSPFKNLEGFKIDLPEDSANPVVVLLGPNATGKSNLIEALVLIFKHLDLDKKPLFDYEIRYERGGKSILVRYEQGKPTYSVDGEPIKTLAEFRRRKEELLPRYVFTYYSGVSNRLERIFWEHQDRFYYKAIKEGATSEEVDNLRRLFHVQNIHSLFVLLAYYSYPQDRDTEEFLKEEMGILNFESTLFILQKSDYWGKKGKRFWEAGGLVRSLLERLWAYSIAPILQEEAVRLEYREKNPLKRERQFLFISNKEKLKQVAKDYKGNNDFFKALETMYISDLIADIRVKIKKRNVNGEITFRELSEGEQQLLTVLGLLKFTNDEESLVLLDEPDTHLNPLWKWKYLEYLDKVVKRPQSTQIILSTHDPLVIGSLKKEQIRMFRNDAKTGKVFVEHPGVDPQGLGVAGILTSELFGLPTTVDPITYGKLQRQQELVFKQQKEGLTENEKTEMQDLFHELNHLGFAQPISKPDIYQRFLQAYSQREELNRPAYSKEDLKRQNEIAIAILNEIFEEEKQ